MRTTNRSTVGDRAAQGGYGFASRQSKYTTQNAPHYPNRQQISLKRLYRSGRTGTAIVSIDGMSLHLDLWQFGNDSIPLWTWPQLLAAQPGTIDQLDILIARAWLAEESSLQVAA